MSANDSKRENEEKRPPGLLDRPPLVINVGLEGFAAELASEGARVVHVAWVPPGGGDPDLARLLARLGP